MPTDLTAPITAVTVYTHRARVTRAGDIDLPAGETTLVLAGLPDVMDADSVRVSGKGEGITIRGVDVKPDVQEESERNKSLNAQFEDLRKQSKALEHQLNALDEKINYFKALKTQASEESGLALLKDETTFERVTAIADYIQAQLNAAYTQHREVGYEWDATNEQIEALKIRMSGNFAQQTKAGQSIHIAVEAEATMKFTYEIDYLVANAYWKPLYDVRLLEDNSVELTYMARISQETGEDWHEVELSLSTARPAMQSSLPKLDAWYVSEYPIYPRGSTSGFQRLRLEIQDEVNSLQDTIDAMDAVSEQSLRADDYVGRYMEAPRQRKQINPLGAAAGLVGAAAGAVSSAVQAVMPQDRAANVSQTTITNNTSGAIVTYTVGTPVSIPGSGEPHKNDNYDCKPQSRTGLSDCAAHRSRSLSPCDDYQ